MGHGYKGLTEEEVSARLEKHGYNVLPENPPPSSISIFIAQLKSPLVYILLVSGVITLTLGQYADTAIISLAVFINTILGYLQEKKASRALSALKKMLHPVAGVIRSGKYISVPVEEVVPGDIVVLKPGDKVPADGSILQATRLFISEAILTGESAPLGKNVDDEVFMGTTVTAGAGIFKVGSTGENTKMGEIAKEVQGTSEETPLMKQLKRFSKQLTILVVILVGIVFVAGIIGGLDIEQIFITSVALAVSVIPEGLLVALTAILAIGMQRILKRKGLVRNLVSAETLGGVTSICVDKTGTLTQGKQKAVKLVGDKKLMAKQAILTSDHDDPIIIAAEEWAERELTPKDLKGERVDDYLAKHTRFDSLPFSSSERFSATLNKLNARKNVILVNGAPDFLMEWCDLKSAEKEDILEVIEKLTSEGMRLLGMARKEVATSHKKLSKKDITKLTWVGILAFADPVREGVRDAFELAKQAGVRPIVITGDYPQTALSVIKKLKLPIDKDSVILGEELEDQSDEDLQKTLLTHTPMLFARTTPSQKLKIVKALKANGEVVAMTGDGVNDAPALSAADIGVVVSDASDVSKETADIVLLDSSFNTIVKAIEEGRGIFDNIRKVILYLLSDAFSEIFAVLAAIALHLPLPVTASQILWINLISDGFPSLALTIDPKRPHAMYEPPRKSGEPLVTKWMLIIIGMVSFFSGVFVFGLFYWVRQSTGDLTLARSVAFATLGINSLAYVFSVRALREPVWRMNPLNNRWLLVGILGGVVLQVIPFVFGPTQAFFDVTVIPLVYWGYIIGLTALMVALIEITKRIVR